MQVRYVVVKVQIDTEGILYKEVMNIALGMAMNVSIGFGKPI